MRNALVISDISKVAEVPLLKNIGKQVFSIILKVFSTLVLRYIFYILDVLHPKSCF